MAVEGRKKVQEWDKKIEREKKRKKKSEKVKKKIKKDLINFLSIFLSSLHLLSSSMAIPVSGKPPTEVAPPPTSITQALQIIQSLLTTTETKNLPNIPTVENLVQYPPLKPQFCRDHATITSPANTINREYKAAAWFILCESARTPSQ